MRIIHVILKGKGKEGDWNKFMKKENNNKLQIDKSVKRTDKSVKRTNFTLSKESDIYIENEKKLKEIEEQYQKEIKKLDEENKYKLEQLEQQYKLIMDNNKIAIERDIQNYIVNLRNIN